jgi:hypothetical protein
MSAAHWVVSRRKDRKGKGKGRAMLVLFFSELNRREDPVA